MKGRPRKPTDLHLLQGTWRADRHANRQEPRPEKKAPSCPAHITGEQRAIFLWLVKLLSPMRVLTVVDTLKLEGLSAQIMTFRQAQKAFVESGARPYKARGQGKGRPIPNPDLIARDNAWALIDPLASQFGMDPRARTQLKTELQEPVDPVDAFMKRRKG